MPDPQKGPESRGDPVRFTSTNSDIVEVREEDTKPGAMSESTRKRLREKYGRKPLPPDGPAGEAKGP